MADQRAAEIRAALDAQPGAGFDVLRQKLGEDDLFREKLRADDDAVGAMRAARVRGEQQTEQEADRGAPRHLK